LIAASELHNLVALGRDEDALRKLESSAPSRIKSLAGDLSVFSLAEEAVKLAVATFGRVDGLIINHGTLGEVSRIADCDPVGFQKTFDVNFISAVACVSQSKR
jgi:NAD(P)-dependent dehydrogenase (short-subunit alcohol dehydrogenase family)